MNDVTPVIGKTIEEWPPFELTEAPLEDGLVVSVAGELDMATAPALRERLTDATEQPASALVVDLREVRFMDSIGLATILHARNRLGDRGRLAIVLARDSYPHLVLETAGLPKTLALFETLPDAVAHVAG